MTIPRETAVLSWRALSTYPLYSTRGDLVTRPRARHLAGTMALLFDTSAFPGGERDDALTDFFSAAGVPIRATHGERANYSAHHYWKFGTNDLFLARGAGLRLERGPHEVRAAAPEAIRVGYQVSGRYNLSTGSHDESRGTGHLNFTDLTQPCGFTQYGPQAGAMSFQVGYDQLGSRSKWFGMRAGPCRAIRSTVCCRGGWPGCATRRTR